ncbi:MAG: translocation/assembly module TamB domain-containing protein [Terrimicrobiaceae bacterium]
MKSPVNETFRARRIPWRSALVVGGCIFLLWLAHPPLLSHGLRMALVRGASESGLQLEIGNVQAHLARPIVLEEVKLRAVNAEESRTAADANRIEISLNWPWRALIGGGRFFRALIVENVRAVVDLRADRTRHRGPTPGVPEAEQRVEANRVLPWLPQFIEIHQGNLEFVASKQSYYFEDVSADFNEERPGRFRAAGAELRAGPFKESLGSREAITAWKEGTVYLASLDLWEGVKVERFVAQLARPGGAALEIEASLYGGSLRADASFGSANTVDSAILASQLEVAALAAFLGFQGKAEGVIREAKFTFRGDPDRALDGQASLRIAADNFRWNMRGWESLRIGASMIHRRLAVSDFELKQRENIVSGSGEFSLDDVWPEIPESPFLFNVSASIKDLAALAGLLGPPFDEMSGRMSLSGSLNGQGGKLGGFVSLEASQMGFRKRPFDSGRMDITFSNTEAQINRCEFWSGEDFLRATGSVEMRIPHNYSGEIQARTQDISRYRDFYQARSFSNVRSGSAQIRWQGDGTAAAHSGAFNVVLSDLVSDYTPSGVTGRFEGTYSPENVYFSRIELQHDALRFSTCATLARSGIRLNDALLRSGLRKLSEGELYLPLDPFDIATGKSLEEAIHLDENLYASIVSQDPLNVRELLRLAGNDRTIDGTVELNLNAAGTPSAFILDGRIEGRGLTRMFENGWSPAAQFDAAFHGADGLASLNGELASSRLTPMTFKAEGPFGLVRSAEGRLHWMNPEGAISASLDIPGIDIGILRTLFPRFQQLDGFLSGNLSIAGTIAKPLLEGELVIGDGRLEFSKQAPLVHNVNGAVNFNAERAMVEGFRGAVGDGSFEVRGGASLENLFQPYYELFFYGSKVDLVRMEGLQLKANVDLYASGNGYSGMIKGALRFDDSRFSRRVEITPLQAPSPEEKAFSAPNFQSLVPTSIKAWQIDVSVRNDTTFSFSGNAASGEIIPDLRITGTVGNPIPVGKVELKNARIFFPFTTMTIPEGHIEFLEDSPWMPQLDLRGSAQALDYEVEAYAFGPLSESRLILRSEPPLPQEMLIQLLTTGMAPGVYAGTAPSEAQGGLALPSGAGGKSQRQDVRMGSIASGLRPYAPPGGRATLRGRFELWRGLSLINESDVFGPSNARAYFNWRLR